METVQALEAGNGLLVRQLQIDAGGSKYKLCVALRKQAPALYITDAIASAWLQQYGGAVEQHTFVQNAGHLEQSHGERIRKEALPM